MKLPRPTRPVVLAVALIVTGVIWLLLGYCYFAMT